MDEPACRRRKPHGLAGIYLAARTADVEKDVPSAASLLSLGSADPIRITFLLERALVLTRRLGRRTKPSAISRKQLFDNAAEQPCGAADARGR